MNHDQHSAADYLKQVERSIETHKTGTRRGALRLADKLNAVGTLFGDPLADELRRALEDVTENASEHAHWLSMKLEHVSGQLGDIERHARTLNVQRIDEENRVARLVGLVEVLADELDKRNKRAGRPPSTESVNARRAIKAETTPF